MDSNNEKPIRYQLNFSNEVGPLSGMTPDAATPFPPVRVGETVFLNGKMWEALAVEHHVQIAKDETRWLTVVRLKSAP